MKTNAILSSSYEGAYVSLTRNPKGNRLWSFSLFHFLYKPSQSDSEEPSQSDSEEPSQSDSEELLEIIPLSQSDSEELSQSDSEELLEIIPLSQSDSELKMMPQSNAEEVISIRPIR